MDSLVLSNIFFRKTRTLVSIAGVALGVILVVLTVGIVNGFLNEQGRRNAAVTAEIMFHPEGGFSLGVSNTPQLKVELADELRQIEGVEEAVPVANTIRDARVVDGLVFDQFTRVSEAHIIEGRAIAEGDEVVIDSYLRNQRGLKVGDQMQIFDRPFRIVGVYEPESLGRVKIPLATLQSLLNRPFCSFILVKVKDPSRTDEVAARIKERFPRNDIRLTRDVPIMYARGTPALQSFIRVVIALAIVVSALVILLAMYTTVTERTRQIGVLKSLGASRSWIAGEIEKEALVISLLGVLAGFAISFGGKLAIQKFTPIQVEFDLQWFAYALLLGVASGLLGALYPALRAANQDPVKALSYE
jgi:putative ABC transport system permease protein